MGKHRKHKKNYDVEYVDSNYDDGMNTNNLSSILGNIDINQIASLLSSAGIISNDSANNEDSSIDKGESNQAESNNIDIVGLLNKANNLNNMIMRDNLNLSEEFDDREDKRRTHNKSHDKRDDDKNTQLESFDDSVVSLLKAIKPLVYPDKAQIIDKIIELYIQGKI